MTPTVATDPSALTLAAVVLLAALLATWRTWRHVRRHRVALLLLQWPLAALLLAALLLRIDDTRETLTVFTAGGGDPAIDASAAVRLPGAEDPRAAVAVPDLATALRRFPAVRHLHVVGDGLATHDRDAVRHRTLDYAPTRPPPGMLLELDAPAAVVPGAYWQVHGRLAPGADHSVALVDPAGDAVATATPDRDGRFVLQGLSRAPGPTLFRLHVLAGERLLQDVPVPVDARTPAALRVHVLAAAPSPELRGLRRWALDAGIELGSRIDVAPGLPQRRGAPALDADTLARLDLLVLDERSWALVEPQRALLRDAIADGLGLLVRVSGPVPERVAQAWRELGIELAMDAARPRTVTLAAATDAASGAATSQALLAWPARGDARDETPLLRATDGTPLAWRRTHGRGRIGVWTLADSFRLATRGEAATHATLWSTVVADVARARGAPDVVLPARAVVGRRATLCADGAALRVTAPSQRSVDLVPDADAGGCAALWPREAGWHRVAVATDAATVADTASFYVHDPADIDTLLQHETRAATSALADSAAAPAAAAATALSANALRAWLLAAWLALACFTWWLERRARTAAG